jgi:hypothetical protein
VQVLVPSIKPFVLLLPTWLIVSMREESCPVVWPRILNAEWLPWEELLSACPRLELCSDFGCDATMRAGYRVVAGLGAPPLFLFWEKEKNHSQSQPQLVSCSSITCSARSDEIFRCTSQKGDSHFQLAYGFWQAASANSTDFVGKIYLDHHVAQNMQSKAWPQAQASVDRLQRSRRQQEI